MEATLHSVKSRLVQTREGGEVTGNERFWDVTFRMPSGRIDANELGANLGDLHHLTIDCIQTRLPFKAGKSDPDGKPQIEFGDDDATTEVAEPSAKPKRQSRKKGKK